MRYALWFGCFFCPASLALAALTPSTPWQWVPIGTDAQIVAVAAHHGNPAQLLAASPTAVYETRDQGNHWEPVFRAPGAARIQALAWGATALACTSEGLYAQTVGQEWSLQPLPEQATFPCTALRADSHDGQQLWMSSEEQLYQSRDGGVSWQRVSLPAAAGNILDIAADSRSARTYVLTTTGLFLRSGEASWIEQHRLPQREIVPPSESSTEDAPMAAHTWQAIALHPQEAATVYAATARGVLVSRDEGRAWQPLTRAGLRSLRTTALAGSAEALWAATPRGLFRHTTLPLPEASGAITGPDGLLQDFPHEPTIGQVQAAAIRYAEVHPDKIRHWRRQAALQALLPSLSFGLDRDRAHNVHYDEGSFPNFQIVETTDRDAGFDISVNWDLGELIWNDDQTSIDTRSKLMVELREDIVDAVTRTYFERRRLQARLLWQPPPEAPAALEQELRIAELTALLDGFTGGYFSQPQEVR